MEISSSSFKKLREACGGLDRGSLVYGKCFTPIGSCELLLSVDGFETALENNEESWIRLASKLLPVTIQSEKCRRIFMKLVSLILINQNLQGRETFLDSLWQYVGTNTSSDNLELMELLLLKAPKNFEIGMIDLFMVLTKAINKADLPTNRIVLIKQHPITQWSSRSRLVFSFATSIANEILLRSAKQNPSFGETISDFIYDFRCCVADMCWQFDVTGLYPLKHQGLVSMLSCMEEEQQELENVDEMNEKVVDAVLKATDALKCKLRQNLIQLVDSKLKCDPVATIAILTHHPSCITFLNYCE